jgi:hypothetical protein
MGQGREKAARKKLFREIPPRDLVDSILRACGINAGLADLRWFVPSELRMTTQEEWLPLLEPYYLPCKARRFFEGRGDIDGARMITIFRHILEPHQYCLKVEERMYRDKKQSVYQVQPVRSWKDLSGVEVEVRFD